MRELPPHEPEEAGDLTINTIAASIIVCLASDVGQRWQWDGIHPSTLTLVGAAPAAELATLVLEDAIANCWALAWEGGSA